MVSSEILNSDFRTIMCQMAQGQNLTFLRQLPAGLPKITISIGQQLTIKMSVAIWATVRIFSGSRV